MPIILIVDDSEVDRTVMAGLLGSDLDWLISQASNGAEALRMMADATPDAVVTDLLMPEMDGMELVKRISQTYSEVPVVLVTSQDDIKLAFKALKMGAASYVPKSQLADRLLDTVEQVLAVSDMDHFDDRIVQATTNTRYRFNLENDLTLIAPLVDRVQMGLLGMHLCSPTQRMHIGIALEEALTNAMCHGNLELPVRHLPEIRRQLHEGKRSEMVEERRHQSPYKDRRILVAADLTRQRAQFVVADQGAGFDEQSNRPKSLDEIMEGECGRGILLIRSFMDEVVFNETGNEIRMTLKDLRPSPKTNEGRSS
ncbi:ATP-binding response regulator [Novipirellula artificiosorum]|uniref:Nitrogen regulation protein NR(I) n=1 Tax=Novipirellula artificiosorum TaxID=2528016 RepID=A0A5C6DZS5_9BACT|nr:response regulator [Novipirellula artificiosorum]TWU40961.1 Nitrogen regulation protein NR(I) [Novipirellula artificiosorum]